MEAGWVQNGPIDRNESVEKRINDLESQLDDLRRQLAAAAGTAPLRHFLTGSPAEMTGRRTFVHRAGAVAAATVAGVVAAAMTGVEPAFANPDLTLGSVSNTASSPTGLSVLGNSA